MIRQERVRGFELRVASGGSETDMFEHGLPKNEV